ncbi:MAG: GerMN domain-containing protein [Armatimonadetes bacterium]|nr:GerMN domain-containing protein [Armatimonadota bacterium]
MRTWLSILTLVVLILLAFGALTYSNLERRVSQLERQAAQRPPVNTPPSPERGTEARERSVAVYFGRLEENEVQLVPVTRQVSAREPAAGALQALLQGPAPAEHQRGLTTQIPAGTRLRSVTIRDGTAHAVFSPELDRGIGGSLRVTTIRRQIEATLRQFPNAERVVIEVDGRIEDVLQP